MKLVIDIQEKVFKKIEHQQYYDVDMICEAILSGTPLPKGHGRLVDIGKMDEDKMESDNPIIGLTIDGHYIEAISLDYLNDLPTIIEADKEVSAE